VVGDLAKVQVFLGSNQRTHKRQCLINALTGQVTADHSWVFQTNALHDFRVVSRLGQEERKRFTKFLGDRHVRWRPSVR
jgi:hypothetical protein